MKKVLLASILTASLALTSAPLSAPMTAAATDTEQAIPVVSADSESADHTFSSYYAQGYTNALMSLHTYSSEGAIPYHIASIMNNKGRAMHFSFNGEDDFVEGFGASDTGVIITGENRDYVVSVSQASLVQEPSMYDINTFSSFLNTTQNFTSDKLSLVQSQDGSQELMIASVSDIYNEVPYTGYLCLMIHPSSLSGMRFTYLMPADSYDDARARTFIDSLSFADDEIDKAVEDAEMVSIDDDYTRYTTLDVLADTGFFNYRSLSAESFDKAQQLVKPALIELFHADSEDSPNGWSGSGVIYDIQPDYIYFLTVAHVADHMQAGNNELWLYDGTRLTFDHPVEYTRLSDQNEICIFRIETSMIPMSILRRIREITVDPTIYGQIQTGAQLLAIATNYKHTRTDLTTPMTLLKLYDAIPEDKEATVYLSGTLALQEGMSGTAVIDMHGNLVGIADSKNNSTNKSYALMIDQLETLH